MGSVRVAVDVGGTFTDIFVMDEAGGRIDVHKVPSTPADPGLAIVEGLRGIDVPFSEIKLFSHGTTVGTNALITRSFPRAALITTRGFRDVLEIRDSTRTELWDAYWDMPPPYIPRRDRFEIDERLASDGAELEPVDAAQVADIARILKRRGISTVAVCLINSYVDGAHERQVRDILAREMPGADITISVDILPEMFEFPRTSTTVANAVLGPVVGSYMRRLRDRLAEGGYAGNVLVLHSGGGVMTAETASSHSARLAASGLAGGAVAMAHVARQCGLKHALGLDIGGTSSDISIMYDDQIRITQDWSVEPGYPIRFPSIELVTVGAGGGSVAWIDDGGSLRNGPESVGADPGPACYRQGGERATNTDANVVLGRLGTRLIGGRMLLDRQAAADAVMDHVGKPMGLGLEQAAAAVLRVANANIADAIRVLSVQKGYDPRAFALVAFGGAGPLHAVAVAREVGIPKVVIPPHPGITSAMGCALVDVRHDVTRTLLAGADAAGFAELGRLFAEAELQLSDLLQAEQIAPADRSFERFVTMRYVGQWRSLSVPCPEGEALDGLLAAFHRQHQREFAYAQEDRPVEFFGIRVAGIGTLVKPALPDLPRGDGAPVTTEFRSVWFDEAGGFVETPIHQRTAFRAGQAFQGPAIVEQLDSTVVIPPATRVRVEPNGSLVLELSPVTQ